MYACIYELRKNCCGWTGRVDIEGSTRGPRGPKNATFLLCVLKRRRNEKRAWKSPLNKEDKPVGEWHGRQPGRASGASHVQLSIPCILALENTVDRRCGIIISYLFIFDITWVKWADKRKIKIFKSKGLAIMAPFTGL